MAFLFPTNECFSVSTLTCEELLEFEWDELLNFDHFCPYIYISKPLKHKDNHVVLSFVQYCILAYLMILSLSLFIHRMAIMLNRVLSPFLDFTEIYESFVL